MEQNQQAGLELNVSKSTTFFFSTASGEASWRPDITLLGEKMGFGDGVEENPSMFLGLRLEYYVSRTTSMKCVHESSVVAECYRV